MNELIQVLIDWLMYWCRYDVAPLRVRVLPDTPPIWRFLLRLCAIVGGVYTSAGNYRAAENLFNDDVFLFFFAMAQGQNQLVRRQCR